MASRPESPTPSVPVYTVDPPPKPKRGRTSGLGKSNLAATNAAAAPPVEALGSKRRALQVEPDVISSLSFPLPKPEPIQDEEPVVQEPAPSVVTPTEAAAPSPMVRGQRSSKLAASLKLDSSRVIVPVAAAPSPPRLIPTSTPGTPFLSLPPDPSLPHFTKNPALQWQGRERAPPLDFSTVKTSSPRDPPKRTQERMFGIQEAPTFYPTLEEFQDPMEYIRWCGKEQGAEEFGICKIVPPQGWQPPFVMDTTVRLPSSSFLPRDAPSAWFALADVVHLVFHLSKTFR